MGWYNPPNRRNIHGKNGKCNQFEFLQVMSKSSWTAFKTIFETSPSLEPFTWPLLEGRYTRNPWFFRLLGNIAASFFIFVREIFLVARSYRVHVITIKSLIIGALVTLEMRLKVPILAVFLRIFDIFRAICFSIRRWFLY